MNWYYVNAGKSVGPVSDADLEKLAQTGSVSADTLVWNESMKDWQPFAQVKPAAAGGPPPTADIPASASAATGTLLACSQCGKVLPPENLVSLQGSLVCAECKPVFLQKMREGAAVALGSGPMEFAGIGTRLAAKILDAIILGGIAAVVIGLAAGLLVPLIARSQNQNQSQGVVFILILGVLIAAVVLGLFFYQIWCLPKYGGTPGKRILNIKIVTATGGPITWGRSFGRFFAEMLNGLIPLWIGYIIAIFDAEKRTVHDHIAGTRVVKR